MGPFEVRKEMVAALDDAQVRKLLERLLIAEANQRSMSHFGISVGGNQTAGDGGVDASINWTGAPEPSDWLPRRSIYFQCKAEAMAAAKLRDEMRPSGVPRPIFAELAASNGAYIVFATDDPTKLGLDTRLAAMENYVADVADRERLHLDFYGADRIARWVNLHPGVALWLLGQSGRSLGGWQPFGDWSAPGSSGQPYILDDSARAALGDTVTEMGPAIGTIRDTLRTPGGIVRLVGLSGMGKTRLAEALFDESVAGGTALREAAAIYGDAGLDLETGVARVAEELVLAGAEAVLVVDNCNGKTHGQLADIVRRPGARISLLTIDYDIGGEKPAGLVVTLGENSELVLMSLLQQRVPSLSDAECRHLAEFSGGNARIALKIAEGAADGIDLSKLNDSELLERLFQTGRQERDPQARACADAAALVYAFYVEAGDHQQAEHPVLAAIAGVGVDVFFRNIATFLDWGVVQQRGPQRAVMPPPLANMLAAPFVRRSDPTTLLNHFLGASPRLLASFARRLGQLHDEPAAVRLASGLLGPAGAFGEPAELDDLLRRGYTMMAPAAPDAALTAFERSLSGSKREELLDPHAPGRRDYPQLLVHLAHEQALFGRAMEVLLAFALADGDAKDDREAKKHLLERFWPRMSFTLADQPARLLFLDRLIDDDEAPVRALAVESLDHMLDAGYFSSSLNVEFGAKARLTEWRPRGHDGYVSWFGAAYDRATRIATGDTPEAERAREIIADHFRDHLDIGLPDLAIDAMRKARGDAFWDAGWRAVTDGLQFSGKALAPAVHAEVLKLEQELRPKTVAACFEAFVLGEPWRHYHPQRSERHSIRNVRRLAKAVGVRLARTGEDPAPFLDRAMRAEGQNSTSEFAFGLARATDDLSRLWETARIVFAGIPASSRLAGVLSGILQGAAARDKPLAEAWLEAAVTDSLLAKHLVVLQLGVRLDEAAMERLSRALAHGEAPVWTFGFLHAGSVTKPVPAQALANFLDRLYEADGGIIPALQVLHMRMFGDRDDKVEVDPALILLGRKFLADARTFDEKHVREDHAIGTIAKVALAGEDGRQAAIATCRALRRQPEPEHYQSHEFDRLCTYLMKAHPRVVFDEIVAKGVRHDLLTRFFGGHARNDDDADQTKIRFEEVVAREWMLEAPDERAALLAELVPYSRRDNETGLLAWSPFALELIAAAPDPVPVLDEFADRFFSGSGSGPLSGRFVRRRPLVAVLLTHDDARIRKWARSASARLEDSIKRWDERDRDRQSRFE